MAISELPSQHLKQGEDQLDAGRSLVGFGAVSDTLGGIPLFSGMTGHSVTLTAIGATMEVVGNVLVISGLIKLAKAGESFRRFRRSLQQPPQRNQ